MLILASLVTEIATEAGFTAAMIAVCGFLAAAVPALEGRADGEIRKATVAGGLGGVGVVVFVNLVQLLLTECIVC